MGDFTAVAGAGTLRSTAPDAVVFPHRWTADGVRVAASGDFEADTWRSSGIGYSVQVDTTAPAEVLGRLLEQVDSVAEIPKSIRAGARVDRLRE